jgi:TolA-binding protein
LLALVGALVAVPALPADEKSDRAAAEMLAGARRAYTEKNYPAASTRFREFLTRFPSHSEVPAARYGLALTLLHNAEPDYKGAAEQLQLIAGAKGLPEHAFILYHLAVAQRGLGIRAAAQSGKPDEAAANAHFRGALQHFAEASKTFAARVPASLAPGSKDLPGDLEWAARAHCDEAEMQLRLQQFQEARTTAGEVLKDPRLSRSRARDLALYYHGFASFLLKDYLTAGRSLNLLTPFADPAFGPHARYLLARVYHLTDERAKAAGHYEGVLADYEKHKAAALKALQRPDTFKNDPAERARLEALTRDPPDHVARATFFLGLLFYENGRFADAEARLADFIKRYPNSPLGSEARLRLGLCQVQLKQYAQAIGTLQPLAEKEPRLADQALLWLGRAQVGAAHPENAQAYQQALKVARATFQRAADKAQALAATDSDAKTRQGEILLELADTQQLAGQFQEAAATCAQLLKDHSLPQRDEEVLQRQLTALHLAGDYAASDKACARIQQLYPESTLLPLALFRHAENAFFWALAAEKDAALADRDAEVARRMEEAARRCQTLLDRFPNFEYASVARYRLALISLRKGDLEKAKDLLAAIPTSDCIGDLVLVPYLQADCLIRLAPVRADDALAAGRLEEELHGAIELLDGFVSGQPQSPQTPGALLRLGLCHQRLALLLVKPEERAQELAQARAAYEKVIQQFPRHELQPQALFEKAKWRTLRNQPGDLNKAMDELRHFTGDPLKKSAIAPLALVQLAVFLRSQNKAAEAAEVLAQCRQHYEAELLKRPELSAWVALLQYQHGIALQEAGKLPEARAVLEGVVKQFPTRPEAAKAALRYGQCLKAQGMRLLEAGRPKDEGLRLVRDAAGYLEKRAGELEEKPPAGDARARLLYEAAWSYRILAEAELAASRPRKDNPSAEIPVAKVPLQPAERKVRALYQELIATYPDLPLTNYARLELAEVHAERGEHTAAVPLLRATLEKDVPPELADKARLRLGACLQRQGDTKPALEQFEALARNPKGPLAAQARYRAGECCLQRGEWAAAVKQLAVFRDQEPFRNLPHLSDRALLGLGHALAELRQWDQSRQAFEQLTSRFGNSPWLPEARYGMGWAWQKQKQYDQAVNAYAAAVATKAPAVTAWAQLQIGLCRLEQKRYADAAKALEAAAAEHSVPEVKAIALVEAAWSHAALKQRDQAEKLLRQVLRDYTDSKLSAVAKERLKALGDPTPPPRHDLLVALRQPSPEVEQPMPLSRLGQSQSGRTAPADPTGEISLTLALSGPPPAPKTPAPFLRPNLPDPFEHRHPARPVTLSESRVPFTLALRWSRP